MKGRNERRLSDDWEGPGAVRSRVAKAIVVLGNGRHVAVGPFHADVGFV
jgi:hypothetical protein